MQNLNINNWNRQLMWFIVPLLILLLFLVQFDMYPTEWLHIHKGISYIMSYMILYTPTLFKMNPFVIYAYPELYKATLNLVSIYGVTYLGYNLKLLLIDFLTTNEMDKASKRSKLRKNIKDYMLKKKQLNIKISLHKYDIGTMDENIKLAEEELKNLDK